MSGHTPGPWTLAHGGYIQAKPTAEHFAKFPKNKRVMVGHVVTFAECMDEQAAANARLIAAAPELADALQSVARLIDQSPAHGAQISHESATLALSIARAALAKAGVTT